MCEIPARRQPFWGALIRMTRGWKPRLAALAGLLLTLALCWGGPADYAVAAPVGIGPQVSPPPAQERLKVTYNRETKTIEVNGRGAVVRLTDVDQALRDRSLLEQLRPAEWLLKVNLKTFEEVRLQLHGRAAGGDVDWLKIRSEPSSYATVESSNGQISIRNTRITSWDPGANTFDTAIEDGSGRAFVSIKNRRAIYTNNRMEVVDSEVAYLGFFEETAYGISWKVISGDEVGDTGILGKGMTGIITGSKFHHNYFGVYVFGVGDMVVRNNEFYENVRYGFEPHTFTQRPLVENNFSHNNGTHGIIFAEDSTENTVRHNTVTNNKGHGIMVHERSNNNVIEDNTVTGNDDGVPVFESSNNTIARNVIRNNRTGVRIYGRAGITSSNNLFEDNEISGSASYGVFAYDAVTDNTFRNNRILSNEDAGVFLKGVFGNIFQDNVISGNEHGVRFDSSDTPELSRGNQIHGNDIKNNRQFGVTSFGPESNNVVEGNRFSGNGAGDINTGRVPVVGTGRDPSLLQTLTLAIPVVIVVAGGITALLVILRKRAAGAQ